MQFERWKFHLFWIEWENLWKLYFREVNIFMFFFNASWFFVNKRIETVREWMEVYVRKQWIQRNFWTEIHIKDSKTWSCSQPSTFRACVEFSFLVYSSLNLFFIIKNKNRTLFSLDGIKIRSLYIMSLFSKEGALLLLITLIIVNHVMKYFSREKISFEKTQIFSCWQERSVK